jgi:hypothetical protein
MRCPAGPFLLLASLCTGATWAADQDQHRHTGADPKKVGIVRFENSCSPLVQERIGRAMALLHSFWYEEVDREFRGVTAEDPKCTIAWWGVAMAQWQPLWEVRGPSRQALASGRAAIEKGRAIPSGTARERDYVAALEKFYAGFETVDHTERVLAYERAMEALRAKYPSDPEAAVFYALAEVASEATLKSDRTRGGE